MPRHAAADEVGRQPLVVGQLVLDQQQLPPERARVLDPLQPDQRPLIGAGTPGDRPRLPRYHERGPLRQLVPRRVDVEAPVQAVRLPHPAGGHERQSTTSTSTRWFWRTAAAFTTVLSAATVRPPRPITLPASSSATCSSSTRVPSSSSNDSTFTSSGLSTSDRTRYSRSSFTYSSAASPSGASPSAGSVASARSS